MLKKLIALGLALAITPTLSIAETAQEKGQAIAVESDKRGQGFVDSVSSMKMILINKRGDSSQRDLRVKTLEGEESEGDKSLTIFDTPKDQKGTALLTFTHKGDTPDDQWLYLPALKRVKKIASKNKSGPFMGSEFSFEDMGNQEIDKYTYTHLRDETLDGRDCFVLERVPVDKYSGYTKMISWVDKSEYRAWKTEYYDRKKSHLKTLTVSDFKLYNDKFWRPTQMHMQNLQTGKATTLEWSNIAFATGLSDSDFNTNSLKRAR